MEQLSCDERQQVLLLDSYFEHIYARALIDLFPVTLKECCYGCITDHGSQVHHQCVMLSTEEQIQFCFEDTLKKVDEQDLLIKWCDACTKLECVSPEILAMYKLKIYCADWRAGDMKSESWKENMRGRMYQIIQLERLFD